MRDIIIIIIIIFINEKTILQWNQDTHNGEEKRAKKIR